jgi:hypothetical protein
MFAAAITYACYASTVAPTVVVKTWKKLSDHVQSLQQPTASYELSSDFSMGFESHYEFINIARGFNITIIGDGNTVLNAFSKDMFFLVETHAALVLRGLSFTYGKSRDGYGAGALAIDDGAVVGITNCTFASNDAVDGSGGAISNMGLLTATHCYFANNTAGGNGGGAISIGGGQAIIDHCTFVDNAVHGAYVGGGAISMVGGYLLSAIITECAFENNRWGSLLTI